MAGFITPSSCYILSRRQGSTYRGASAHCSKKPSSHIAMSLKSLLPVACGPCRTPENSAGCHQAPASFCCWQHEMSAGLRTAPPEVVILKPSSHQHFLILSPEGSRICRLEQLPFHQPRFQLFHALITADVSRVAAQYLLGNHLKLSIGNAEHVLPLFCMFL